MTLINPFDKEMRCVSCLLGSHFHIELSLQQLNAKVNALSIQSKVNAISIVTIMIV